MIEKAIKPGFDFGKVSRRPSEISADPSLTNARKIELLKSYKDHNAAPDDRGVMREADLEIEKLLKLNSLANER